MWETILISAITLLVSLTITAIFNGIVNLPKKKRQEEQKREQENEKFKNDILRLITEQNERTKAQIEELILVDKRGMEDLALCKLGLQAVLKNSLKTRYEKWLDLGFAPLDAKDDLERMYQVYHKLGANGVMDSIRVKFLALPEAVPNKK